MADDTNESRAMKLAAARKKLKEYQSRAMENNGLAQTSAMTTSSTSVASSERSEGESNSVESNTPNFAAELSSEQNAKLANYFNAAADAATTDLIYDMSSPSVVQNFENVAATGNSNEQNTEQQATTETFPHNAEHLQQQQTQPQQQQVNAMQLLIAEKTQLSAEMERYRSLCHEKDATIDDLRSNLNARNQEIENLQQHFRQQQANNEQLRKLNAELMHKLSQANAVQEDQQAHIGELQQQLKNSQQQVNELEQKLLEKSKECELAQLRIQQISVEGSNAGKTETAPQNQFMYEQQIRDLQAMVQQFAQDKEQASIQYQNYVQHLNAEIAKLNERNADLNDSCTQLQERERQLIEHVSELEREIQKNLTLRQSAENKSQPANVADNLDQTTIPTSEVNDLKAQIAKLEERLSDFDLERHEFQLKIKSQEDRLEDLQKALNEKETALDNISVHLPEQAEQAKLLAAMESDKIAAARAVEQNQKLKQQLDEMETRFVQLTNDKAELTIALDKEIFEKRALLARVEEMEQRLQTLDEKFQNKDEEMIRLSHENMELLQKNALIEQQIERYQNHEEIDYQANNENAEQNEEQQHENAAHEHGHDHEHNHFNCDASEKHDHEHAQQATLQTADTCQEAEEVADKNAGESENKLPQKKKIFVTKQPTKTTPHIATAEAVEKLQARFTFLMSQIADLTDEKQRLEHLVMQLQGETETIGEYIALYQTQRRILKQREYEKSAQTRLLQEEREKLREKVAQLNELVAKLGLLEKVTKSNDDEIQTQLQAALAESVSIEPEHQHKVGDQNVTASDYQQNVLPTPMANDILMQIQNIVSEIKENATRDLPLLDAAAAATNNAIEICHCCEGQLKVV